MCLKILKPKTEINKSYGELKILTLDQLIELEHNKLAYKISKGTLPRKIKEIIHCDQNNKSLQKTTNTTLEKSLDQTFPDQRLKITPEASYVME